MDDPAGRTTDTVAPVQSPWSSALLLQLTEPMCVGLAGVMAQGKSNERLACDNGHDELCTTFKQMRETIQYEKQRQEL